PRCPPRPQGVMQSQPGPDAALGIIVVGLRDPKVGHHFVLQVLRHIALQRLDNLRTDGVVVPDNALYLFGVAVVGMRVDECTAEHSEDAAFGRSGAALRRAWRERRLWRR